jgi:hypothetical protein
MPMPVDGNRPLVEAMGDDEGVGVGLEVGVEAG